MTNIGTYQGIRWFECTDEEYSKLSTYKYCGDGDIYIIDGVMIKNDLIIGYYDGKSIREECNRISYSKMKGNGVVDHFSNMKSKNEMKNSTGESETALIIPSLGELKEYFDSLNREVDAYLKEVGL